MKTSIYIYGLIVAGIIALIFNSNPGLDDETLNVQRNTYTQTQNNQENPSPESLQEVEVRSSIFTSNEDNISTIGVAEGDLVDNPNDNTIEIYIDGQIPASQKVYLEYDLFGVKDFNSVCKSVNENLSMGGQIVSVNNEWSHQSELIPATMLNAGINRIRFSIPEGSSVTYKVKNVQIHISEETYVNKQLVLNQDDKNSYYGEYE